jgi:hypothetical protein
MNDEMKKISILFFCYTILQAATIQAAAPDNTLFTQVLSDHVKNGVVDYKAIKQDKRFDDYIRLLQKADPQKIETKDQLAFWLNVYNAFTLKIVIDHYPVKSIMDLNGIGGFAISYVTKSTVWDKKFIVINGQTYSLNTIENDIIRKAGDARVHFAIVCAAKSCPPLRSEAYETDKLDAQLTSQGKTFLSQKNKNYVDLDKKEIYLSKIFDWFADDFKKNAATPLDFTLRFLPDDIAAKIKADPKAFKLNFTDYDWSLNE